jgi:arginase family enzyme
MTVSSGGYTPPADLPTFGRGLSFLDAPMGNRDADYVVAGVPMDWATSNRAGTREGPNAIRAVSRLLFDGGHPTIGADPKDLNLSDIGNFDVRIGDIAQSHQMIERQAWPQPSVHFGRRPFHCPAAAARRFKETWSAGFGAVRRSH